MKQKTIKLNGITKALKAHSKETGMKPFTTQIQYKTNSTAAYYEYTNSTLLIRFVDNVFNADTNIKLFPDSSCSVFPITDNIFPKNTEETKTQVFNTRLLLDTIRKLEKNPKTYIKETKKHRFIDYSFYGNCFTNALNTISPVFFRVDSYHLKTIVRIFSMLQCEETTIFYNENHPHRPIILECELATAVLTPIRYL